MNEKMIKTHLKLKSEPNGYSVSEHSDSRNFIFGLQRCANQEERWGDNKGLNAKGIPKHQRDGTRRNRRN